MQPLSPDKEILRRRCKIPVAELLMIFQVSLLVAGHGFYSSPLLAPRREKDLKDSDATCRRNREASFAEIGPRDA